MKPLVALIDYDMGNLRSVSKSLEKAGARVRWVDSPNGLKGADLLALPGVGAFSVAVQNLRKRRLFDPVRDWVLRKRPFLGICLGYQLLFEKSDEGSAVDRRARGLGLFKGKITRLPNKNGLKVPHIGWNQIGLKKKSGALKGIREGSYFYFVHSYVPVPKDLGLVSTTSRYGISFASSISTERLFACQFHPEKSGETGLKLLKNFIRPVLN